jgi:hypothetical protein
MVSSDISKPYSLNAYYDTNIGEILDGFKTTQGISLTWEH